MHHSQQHISKQFSSSQEVVQQQTQQQFMSQQRIEQSFSSRQVTHHQTQQRGQFLAEWENLYGWKMMKWEKCARLS